MGDTGYVPWAEGGIGGTIIQVTVLGDGDEELKSQGSAGEGGEKVKKRKREKEVGTF